MSVFTFSSSDTAAIEQCKNDNPINHVWINGAETIIYTGDDIEVVDNANT